MFHGFGLGINIHTILTHGAECILMPNFDKKSYAKMLWKKQPNFIAGVPTIFEALLHLQELDGKDLSLSVYVAENGGLAPDAFALFTGDETESGTVRLDGVEMAYVAGKNSDGDYRIYTWTDRRSQVQMYFLITARLKSSRQTIDEIIDSLRFD